MRHHLRAIGMRPAALGLLMVVACAAWLAFAHPDTLHLFPAIITSGLTSIAAAITITILRRPLGELAVTTARVGDATTAAAGFGLWLASALLLTAAAATEGSPLALATARASLGMATLAVLGLAAGGSGFGIGLPLGWAVATALLERNTSTPPVWAWNLPVSGPVAWLTLTALVIAAAAVARPHLRSGRPPQTRV